MTPARVGLRCVESSQQSGRRAPSGVDAAVILDARVTLFFFAVHPIVAILSAPFTETRTAPARCAAFGFDLLPLARSLP